MSCKQFFVLPVILLGFVHAVSSQNIGIGTSNPLSKLHISNGSSGSTPFVSGLTVESSSFTYISLLSPPTTESAIVFGGQESALRGLISYSPQAFPAGFRFYAGGGGPRMVLAMDGTVGIGVTVPASRLDIAGLDRWDLVNTEGDLRIGNAFHRLKFGVAIGGGGAGAANIMQYGEPGGFNNLSLGSQGKSFLHINGGGDYIDFTNVNGGIRINGNFGQVGQVLTSNAGASPVWKSPTKTMYDNSILIQQGPSFTISASMSASEIPGLTHTFVVSGNTKVMFSYNLQLFTPGCAFCGTSQLTIDIQLNGGINHRRIQYIENGKEHSLTGTFLFTLAPGTHTIRLVVDSSGPDITFRGHEGSTRGNMILHMIPE